MVNKRNITYVDGIECMGWMGRWPSGLETLPDVLSLCPFCGHEAAITTQMTGRTNWPHKVMCSNTSCAVSTPQHYQTRELAIEAWNRRNNQLSKLEMYKRRTEILENTIRNAYFLCKDQENTDGVAILSLLMHNLNIEPNKD